MGDKVRDLTRLLTAIHLSWMFLSSLLLRQPVRLYFYVTPDAPKAPAMRQRCVSTPVTPLHARRRR